MFFALIFDVSPTDHLDCAEVAITTSPPDRWNGCYSRVLQIPPLARFGEVDEKPIALLSRFLAPLGMTVLSESASGRTKKLIPFDVCCLDV